ncbi:MAG TPA: hypothetical protein VK869_02375 [Rubrobacteraceae bacterium]|nr:hypothetical protein [Rubrobacteraceae bacterium]
MPTDRRTSDLARSIALGTTAAAVVSVPTLGPLVLKTRENVERYDTAITPPGYAFAVWAPIFAGIVANAAQAALTGRSRLPENRKTGWPLAGAYALNTAWSVAAQSDRFGYTPALLPAAVALTGVAYRRIQSIPSDKESIASVSTGLLLGWTGLAATVNLSAGTQLLGADATSKTSVVGATLAALGATGVLAAAVGRSRGGYLPLAASSAWGLLTTAADERRTVTARVGTAVGATAVLATASARAFRLGRRK